MVAGAVPGFQDWSPKFFKDREQKLGPSDYVADFGIGWQKVALSF
jgi:hypothetical protein